MGTQYSCSAKFQKLSGKKGFTLLFSSLNSWAPTHHNECNMLLLLLYTFAQPHARF